MVPLLWTTSLRMLRTHGVMSGLLSYPLNCHSFLKEEHYLLDFRPSDLANEWMCHVTVIKLDEFWCARQGVGI